MKTHHPVLLMGLLAWLFGCGPDSPYTQKNGEWYYKKDKLSTEPGETLIPLNRKFAKSNRTAYFESSWLGDVDVATFEALTEHYAKDKHNVWYCDTHRDSKEYWSIKRYRTPHIAGADAPSFRMLDEYYARDTTRVYHDGQPFSVRDINTYERLGDAHARDRFTGYFMRAEIKGSDGPTFSEISGSYSKDAKHVYYSKYDSNFGQHPPVERSVMLPGADPATFQVLEHSYASDAGQAYFNDKVITKSVASFRLLDRGYAIADNKVFYDGAVLTDADAATFEVLPVVSDSASAQDKHGKFNYAKRITQ
ncbi:MAG: DKNYY domain-containing protein [Phycisphaerae bacterium]|nr:DKNYY domain-containing protein [Gemmatimonadaceae bacterium]